MIQAKYFTNIDALNEWLAKNDRFEFLKFFSRSADYFFVVYDTDTEVE